eukprot:TRINITY_DN6186_c0_g1_i3.p1 TRINITY_DN6186_c0_g1~~TRINITY_DN6186_c0_g1_i3.p1  ORF type:complete len:217 (+),score=57.88 TRINITY_DN6186_c0_g1_i3:95-745(+)
MSGRQWSPYVVNGGTALAVAGKGYVIVGADTRMSLGYSIMSRHQPKCTKLTKQTIIATAGMQADRDAFHNLIWATVRQYELDHGYEPSTKAVSQLVSTQLYYRRFFPYYTFNLVAGLDEEGNGAVYGYDAVGSFQRVNYGAEGSGSALATSVFDNQVNFESQPKNKRDIGLDEALALLKDAFTSVGERDIYTGDAVDIYVITKDGIQHELFGLKAD